jgi:signal peptidase II
MSHRLRAAGIVAAVIVIDRITKLYIQNALTPLDVVEVIPGFFNIIHVENPGVAFGMFASLPESWRRLALIAVPLAVMAVISFLLFKPHAGETRLAQTGLALVLGGAMGNLWDRAVRGTVTDFLQFFLGSYEYPSFNAADSAICVGAGLLILDVLRSRRRTSPT